MIGQQRREHVLGSAGLGAGEFEQGLEFRLQGLEEGQGVGLLIGAAGFPGHFGFQGVGGQGVISGKGDPFEEFE